MKYLAVLLVPLLVLAGSMTRTFTFSPYDVTTNQVNGYDLVGLGNQIYTSEPGNPCLPELGYQLLVPPTAEITGVEVISYQVKDVPGSFNIFPAQPALPLSQLHAGTPFTAPNAAVYSSSAPYPGKLVSFVPTGSMSGYRIGGIMVYPVQYIPAERKLKLYTELVVKVNYEEGRHEQVSLSQSQVDLFGADVANLVLNPQDVTRWGPGVKPLFRDSTDFLIITGPTYVAGLAPIANWRSKKGLYTKVMGTDSVYALYPTGRDNAERLRNCIRDYWQTKGTKWVLLAGDISVVPYRVCRVDQSGTIDNIPADLYFADLQWSWDGNRNNIFGECPFNGDTVDLYYDVYLGRGSLENATELGTFIRKDTIYEKRPDPNYMVRMFLPNGNLWTTWTGDSTQNMLARYPASPPWVIRKMYESQGRLTRSACTETLRTGVGFSHISGHGDANGVYMGYGTSIYSSVSDVYNLTNAGRYGISNSQACHSGAFDNNDCYAEAFVTAPNGGSVATMYNSRYGWGYAAGPAGPSELLDMRFYQNFFQSDTTNYEIGKVMALAKHPFRNSAMSQAVWRWCYIEINLMGDPGLAMWSQTPLALTVTHPGAIGRGVQNYTVQVRSSGNPLARATVCLWKGDEVYARAATDATGNVTLAINPLTSGPMSVTVSAKSHLPYEGSSLVGIAEEKPVAPLARSLEILANPVRDRLVIGYALPNRELVNIRLFDAAGRAVGTVAQGRYQGVGQIVYKPSGLASGVYFVRFETTGGTSFRSILVVK